MTTTLTYIKEWQQALQNEIAHLKRFGSNKYKVTNGRILATDGEFTYYFDTASPIRIPIGTIVNLEWGNIKQDGRVLSAEGRGMIIALKRFIGDLISEANLYHDPWELLEQLIQRFDELKTNKRKRIRIKKLMGPDMPAKHPVDKIKSAVHEVMLRSKYNPVTFIWGPPGTGKTYTLARVAANKYFHKKHVLILSHSNQAVDVMLSEITSFIKKKERFHEGDILRYGSNISESLTSHEAITTNRLIEKAAPVLAKNINNLKEERAKLKSDLARSFSQRDSSQLLELETKFAGMLEKVRKQELQFVKDAYVVGTTLAKAASDPAIYEKEFDIVILDEASMAYVPQVAFAATLGSRIIICGDFKQLPPIASSRDPLVTKWLKEDIFHKSGIVEFVNKGKLHPHLFLLKEQRRMHPDISSFTNQYIYHSLVGDHESVYKNRNMIVDLPPFPNRAAILVDTSHMGAYGMTEKASNSRINIWQALLSFQLIHEAVTGGAKSIGYVTPYRAQAALMEMLLADIYEKERLSADIIAATVHRFQGSERDVMIFDTVDSEPIERPGILLTGGESERLINVAITRTKGKFIHVSNTMYIHRHVYRGKILRQFVEHQENKLQNVSNNEIGSWIQNQYSRLHWIHAKKLGPVFKDIDRARSSLVISLPSHTKRTDIWIEKLKKMESRIKFTIISSDDWEELQPDLRIEMNLSFPFVMIDQRLLWLGFPLEGMTAIQPPYIAARLDSERICEYLLSQIKEEK
jgi:hypothetical protein